MNNLAFVVPIQFACRVTLEVFGVGGIILYTCMGHVGKYR